RTAWIIILVSTVVAATACYWLVEITTETAERLEIDIFFVAVILAAAASSVPDTFLSVASAKKGDDDGAVSNAFGSNIFDISVCISIPLLVASYLNGWQPILIEQSGAIVGLQVMLAVLTVATLGLIWHNLQLTRAKAIFLCALYALFIAYAVLGSQGWLLNH
ncbi:MAG: sodium:calcium antiporter, partial [Planctomycetota bacterium]|nr:sodium:calcium antiporter [Planctomycetota bacterium]